MVLQSHSLTLMLSQLIPLLVFIRPMFQVPHVTVKNFWPASTFNRLVATLTVSMLVQP
jgi:hypothetical protein